MSIKFRRVIVEFDNKKIFEQKQVDGFYTITKKFRKVLNEGANKFKSNGSLVSIGFEENSWLDFILPEHQSSNDIIEHFKDYAVKYEFTITVN